MCRFLLFLLIHRMLLLHRYESIAIKCLISSIYKKLQLMAQLVSGNKSSYIIDSTLVNMPCLVQGITSSCGTAVLCGMLKSVCVSQNKNKAFSNVLSTLDVLLSGGLDLDGRTTDVNYDSSPIQVTHAAYLFSKAWQTDKELALSILDSIAGKCDWNAECILDEPSVNVRSKSEIRHVCASGFYVLKQILGAEPTSDTCTAVTTALYNGNKNSADLHEEFAFTVDEIIPAAWTEGNQYQIKDTDTFEVGEICIIKRSDSKALHTLQSIFCFSSYSLIKALFFT